MRGVHPRLAGVSGRAWLVVALVLVTLPAEAERYHRVREGQTLAAIARRYRVSVFDLRAANRMRNDRIRPGQTLTVPDRGVTYVRPGDNLGRVARRNDVSIDELRRANRLRRDARLQAFQRLVLPGYAPRESVDHDWGEPASPGTIKLVRRGEEVEIQLVDAERRVIRESLTTLGAAMRRHDDDAVQAASPRLALLLAKISDEHGGRKVTLVSGFRAAGGRTRETSRHTLGRAADIRIQGVGNRGLWERCRRINHAGCGYYPRSTFVHVDARRTRTQWVDWSRPGRRARYGTLRGPTRNRRRRLAMDRPGVTSDLPLVIQIVEPDGSVTTFDDTHEPEPESNLEEEDGHGPSWRFYYRFDASRLDSDRRLDESPPEG